MESKETRKLLCLRHNGSTNYSLFFDRKTRGTGFWTIKIYFVDHRTKPAKKDRNNKTDSHCESVLFRNLFPAQSNKPLQRALFLDARCFDKLL